MLMTTLSARVLTRMAVLGLNQEELAEKVGVSQTTIQKITSGKTRETRKLTQLAKALQCDADWLGTGEGDHKKHSNLAIGPDIKGRIPLINWVQAGHWQEIIENNEDVDVIEWRDTTARCSSTAFALRIVGDSMTNPYGAPSIPAGSIVIIEPTRQAKNGDIVVALLKDSSEATIKRLVIDGGIYHLMPLNPQYPSLTIKDRCVIIGVAIKVEFDL